MDIINYIKAIELEYGKKICYNTIDRKESDMTNVPIMLRELYKITDGIVFPFGEIYSLEEALKQSEEYVQDKFFCFGRDYLEEHNWLCLYKPNNQGYSFNFSCICKPDKLDGLYLDIIEFLEDMKCEFDNDPWKIN